MEQPKSQAKTSWIEKWIEEVKKICDQSPAATPLMNAEGKIGYIIAWLLGVPVWILLVIFVIRGH